jgi:5-formyltetrahydrofolate cyclo-ligase
VNENAESAGPSDKQTLRRQLRAERRSLASQRSRDEADAIAAAASTLLDHAAYQDQLWVAIYRSLPTEPPTPALAQMLHARGVRVIVPEMLADRDLDWHELRADGTEGPSLGLGAVAAAQLIVVPALAVDHLGTRLGQGGGSYDRALARRRPDAVIVAVLHDGEYAGRRLPREGHDIRVHGVITPTGGYLQIPAEGSAD